MQCEILATGSAGNAVVLGGTILIDCGVSYKLLAPYVPDLQLVLLTHIHSDHFRRATIRRLAAERPRLRWGCGPWLVQPLGELGVSRRQIDALKDGHTYQYGSKVVVSPVPLVHDVPNQGYKLRIGRERCIYCTDTANLHGVSAPNYDLYLIEANYDEAEIAQRIADRKAAGEYAYERRVTRSHLSVQQCDDFIYSNIGARGQYVYMHQHEEKEENEREIHERTPCRSEGTQGDQDQQAAGSDAGFYGEA